MNRNTTSKICAFRICELEQTALMRGGLLNRRPEIGYRMGRQIGIYHSISKALKVFENLPKNKPAVLFFDPFNRDRIVTIAERIDGTECYLNNTLILKTVSEIFSETISCYPGYCEVRGGIWEKAIAALDSGKFVSLQVVVETNRGSKVISVLNNGDRQGRPCSHHQFFHSFI